MTFLLSTQIPHPKTEKRDEEADQFVFGEKQFIAVD